MACTVIGVQTGGGRKERKSTKTVRSYSLTYLVKADSDAETAADVLACDSDFTLGTPYPGDSSAVLKSISASVSENGKSPLWEVTADFDNDSDRANTSPLYPDTPAQISIGCSKQEMPVYRDLDDKPCKNTASDLYSDPPILIDIPIPFRQINVNLSESDFEESLLQLYFNCVNSSTYSGWSRGQVLLADLTATREYYDDENDNRIFYWALSARLEFNSLGWQTKVLSSGYRELYDDMGDTKKRDIRINGVEVSAPIPLDEEGHALIGEDIDDDTFFIEFKTRNYRDLSWLEF